VAITSLGARKWKDVFDRRVDPRGRTYYWMAGDVVECDGGIDVDAVAVRHNLISITPIQLDLTRYDLMDELKEWDISTHDDEGGLPGGKAGDGSADVGRT